MIGLEKMYIQAMDAASQQAKELGMIVKILK